MNLCHVTVWDKPVDDLKAVTSKTQPPVIAQPRSSGEKRSQWTLTYVQSQALGTGETGSDLSPNPQSPNLHHSEFGRALLPLDPRTRAHVSLWVTEK